MTYMGLMSLIHSYSNMGEHVGDDVGAARFVLQEIEAQQLPLLMMLRNC